MMTRLCKLTKGVKPANMAKHKARLIWLGSVSEFRAFKTLAAIRISIAPSLGHWAGWLSRSPFCPLASSFSNKRLATLEVEKIVDP